MIHTEMGVINMKENLNDCRAMKDVSNNFSMRSNGVLNGTIRIIYGYHVEIIRSLVLRDKIKNTINFFSSKVFYALNIQVIVDYWK